MDFDYSYRDLLSAYKKIHLKKNDIIYLTGNLISLGKFYKKDILNEHYKALNNILGKAGTITFPTHTFNLVNKKKIFDLKKTISETGAFTEFLRKRKGSTRQSHPFSSITGIGKKARYICSNNTPHVYGPHSPFDRLIDLNAKFICFGISPNLTASQVHHAEFMMNVPYRYSKTFLHKIKNINGKVKLKEFYLFVLYKELIGLKRERNKKIFKHFEKKNKIKKAKLGKGYIYSYSLKDFYNSNIELLKKDIYCWLSNEARLKFKKIKNKD